MAETIMINNGKTLRDFLSHVIDEGMKSALAQKALTEKEKQAQAGGGGGDVDDLFGDSGGGDAAGGGGGAEDAQSNMPDVPDTSSSSKTMDDETEKLKGGDISAKDIVEKMNSIRSGKSFKDSAVSQAMDDWIGSLSKTERTALFAFLKGIAQIVTGEVPGKQAEDPGKHPSDVKMDKTNEPHVTHKKPNIIHTSAKAGTGGKQKAPEEDTSGPVPITPKKR